MAGFAVARWPAAAELRTITITLVGGQQIVTTVDVPPGTTADQIKLPEVSAPITGIVYQFDLKPGAYLSAGDLVASIGRLDHVHVKVYVDEPDLGRVMKGMPVTITWDALPGRQWKGSVDRTPTEIVAMGARQVGEVQCDIANPDMDLLPGTNVNAVILSETVENAITIPKEAVHRRLQRRDDA